MNMFIIANIQPNSSLERKFTILFLLSLFFFSCTSPQLNNSEENRDIEVQKKEDVKFEEVSQPKKTPNQSIDLVIIPYKGKYTNEAEFQQEPYKISQIRRQIINDLARYASLSSNFSAQVEILFRDWVQEDEDRPYYITQNVREGKNIWQVVFITERLLYGSQPRSVIYRKAIGEVLLQSRVGENLSQFPLWLREGILHYTTETGEWLEKDFILQLLTQKKFSNRVISDALKGVAHQDSFFPELEGYFTLIYLKERIGESGLKNFFYKILLEKKNWEEQLYEITGEHLFPLHEESLKYSRSILRRRYEVVIREYRQAERAYLEEDYPEAILAFQKLITRSRTSKYSFLSGNMYFWSSMCYYRLKMYSRCEEQLSKLFERHLDYCSYLPLARYRYAMSFYHQSLFQKAILHLVDFQESYPFHRFVSSAQFFLADSLFQKKENIRSLYMWERFLKENPEHNRYPEALLKAGKICLEVARYHQARLFFRELAKNKNSSREQRTESHDFLEQINWIVRQTLNPKITQDLNQMVSDFAQADPTTRRQILEQMEMIGELTFSPWLESLIESYPEQTKDFLKVIQSVAVPAGLPIAIPLLPKRPDLAKAIFITLARMDMPAWEVQSMIWQEIDSLPAETKNKVQEKLGMVLKKFPESFLKKFPQLFQRIYGDKKVQLELIEQLTLEAYAEQVSVLHILALEGAPSVQVKALLNLKNWEDPSSAFVLEKLLTAKTKEVRLLALNNLQQLGVLSSQQLMDSLKDSASVVRRRAMGILEKKDIPEKWSLFIHLLQDKDSAIVQQAKNVLLNEARTMAKVLSPEKEILTGALKEKFLKEHQTEGFYYNLVQILEILLGKIDYYPGMTLAERKAIVERGENS